MEAETRRSQSGQLMIIVAAGMVVFLGFAALVIDLGHGYSQRRLAQNAADAAALAAARMVRMSPGSTTGSVIYNELARVAGLNGSAQVDSANTVFLDANKDSLGPVASALSLANVAGVRVKTQIHYPTLFAGILGFSSLTSAGTATAMSLALGGVTGTSVRPFAVRQQAFVAGTEYTVWDEAKEAAGDAGWLDFNAGSNDTSDLSNWLSNGFTSTDSNTFAYWDGAITPGDFHQDDTLPFPSWLAGNTGDKSSVKTETEGLTGKSIIVMVYTTLVDTGSNAKFKVVGLARFTITSSDMHGGTKAIRGTFEQTVIPGDPSATPTTSDMSTIRLTN